MSHRVKRLRPARYWEHESVTLDIHETQRLLDLLQRADLTDFYDGACQTAREKLQALLPRMAPNPKACMTCRHHATHHGHRGRQWMKKSGLVCSGNWPEQGPCKCKRFRGQK